MCFSAYEVKWRILPPSLQSNENGADHPMVLKREARMDFINGKKTIASDLEEYLERYTLKISARKITGIEECYFREEQNLEQMPVE